MTNTEKLNEGAHLMVGFPYQLGYESNPAGVPNPAYDVYDPAGSDPKKGDCSGDVWALWVYSGVKLNGKLITKADRHTAATYYSMAAVKLAQPELPGDLAFLAYSSGTIHHVGIYLGNGLIFQMGDGTGHASIGTVAYWNGRSGVRYARIPGFDWAVVGPVTPPVLVYTDWPEVLKNPCDGPHVKVLKVWLNAVMGSKLDVNNAHFGPSTATVVKAFQKRTWPADKKQWDGQVGDKTQKALYLAFTKA